MTAAGNGAAAPELALSVVIPVFNEADQVAATVRSATAAILETDALRAAEIVVVDDGSSDGSGDAALAAATEIPIRVVRQENAGRFVARRSGLDAARGRLVLYVDAGVAIVPGSLAFVEERQRLDPGAEIWNAHTRIDAGGPIAAFWSAVSAVAFADYVDEPRLTSFGDAEFDRFPKGTTCFLVPAALMRESYAAASSLYRDLRHASDDTPQLRWLAHRSRIWIAPQFACVYPPPTSLRRFFRQARTRGVVFPDSFREPGSRFFPAVVGFYPLSLLLAVAVIRRPLLAPAGVLAVSAAGAMLAAAKRRPRTEVTAVAALAPVYALGHALGMWRGLWLMLQGRLAGRS